MDALDGSSQYIALWVGNYGTSVSCKFSHGCAPSILTSNLYMWHIVAISKMTEINLWYFQGFSVYVWNCYSIWVRIQRRIGRTGYSTTIIVMWCLFFLDLMNTYDFIKIQLNFSRSLSFKQSSSSNFQVMFYIYNHLIFIISEYAEMEAIFFLPGRSFRIWSNFAYVNGIL